LDTQTQMSTVSSMERMMEYTIAMDVASNSQTRSRSIMVQVTIELDQRTFNNLVAQAKADRITVEMLIEECIEENYG